MESPAINDIQRAIAHFSGYDNEEHRRLADEQVRAFLGERLVGRVAPRMDRRRGELAVEGVFAEESAGALPEGALPEGSVAAALGSLAAFAGSDSVSYTGATALGVS